MEYVIRPVGGDDWERVRAMRLEMLADSPTAYLETYDSALALDEATWRWRAAGQGRPAGQTGRWVADQLGEWVATMSAFVDDAGEVHVVAVYVSPAHRGSGVAEALLETVLAWAGDEVGVDRVLLSVVEDNTRAAAFYRRAGFVATGHTFPYELDPTLTEIEMARPVRG